MPRFTLAPQLFNNSAEVAAGAKLYFYTVGTNTLSTVYSDSAETTAHTNPVVVDSYGRVPDIYFTGAKRVVLKDSDDVQLDEWSSWIPPTTIDDAPFATWDAANTYAADEIVVGSDTKIYRSIAGSNLNNNPTSTSGYWTEANLVYEYDAARTYKINEICMSGDVFYRSIAGSNLNNTPASSPSQWRAITTDDFNGIAALYLDGDRDTYLKLDTDDTIDVYVAGANDFRITANTFTALAGSTIKTDTLAETTTDSGVTVSSELVLSKGITDTVYAISDGASVDIDPSNGRYQTWTLGANRTPTATNFANGQSVTLFINDGTAYGVTWTSISVTWLNNGGTAPALATAGFTAITLIKVGGAVYGFLAGNGT